MRGYGCAFPSALSWFPEQLPPAPASLRGASEERAVAARAEASEHRAHRAAATMSFRELRNFKEIMCTLGYPRLISIENFKVPHFELVADILVWLCHRYDKNMEILDEIRTEHDRVAFLKSVAEQLLVKARVKLNLKNLYSSNGFAVRELLKVAQLLHEAHKNASADAEDSDETLPADIGPGHKFADVKLTRSLSADITKYGARLHELLGQHAEAKENAARALGKNFDVDYLQRQLHEMVAQVTDQTEQLRGMLGNLEVGLETKPKTSALGPRSRSLRVPCPPAPTALWLTPRLGRRTRPTCSRRSIRRSRNSTGTRNGCSRCRRCAPPLLILPWRLASSSSLGASSTRCAPPSWTSTSASRASSRRSTPDCRRLRLIARLELSLQHVPYVQNSLRLFHS